MALGTWWAGDPLPNLPAVPAFSIGIATDMQKIADLTRLAQREIDTRWQTGNHIYLAYLEQTPVAYGWVGVSGGRVREIDLAFSLPARNRYLWDFLTFPQWRGRGVYAHFLQEIIRAEMLLAERFWILYEPGNDSAARAISKAGFVFVGELALVNGRVCGIQLFEQSERASAGAALLNLPITMQS